MKLSELKPGTFFEFVEPGYCFGRCLWVGKDAFNYLNFIHRSAGNSRFVHNDEVVDRDPKVNKNVEQCW